MSEPTSNKTVADRLNSLIVEKGFTSIRAAALDMGIPYRTLHGIIHRKTISRSTARLIQHSWRVSPDWLMFGKEPIYCDPEDRSNSVEMFKLGYIGKPKSLIERIRTLQASFDIDSDKHLARLAGIPLKALTHALEVDKIEDETANAIGEALGVEPHWIKEGKGPISSEGRKIHRGRVCDGSSREDILSSRKRMGSSKKAVFVMVPKVLNQLSDNDEPITVKGGAASKLAFQRAYITSLVSDEKNAILIEIDGDSMLPTFRKGDVVMLDLGQNRLTSEDYFGISVGRILQIKQLTLLPNNEVGVYSSNPDFLNYTTKASDIKIVGRVVWYGRSLI